jgi:thymidylate synthase
LVFLSDRVMFVSENSIGRAWEAAVLYTWQKGLVLPTEYGENSRDVVGVVEVLEPRSQPMIHRAVFAWHRKDGYTREVLEGIEDHRIGKDWWYTYHQRLFGYPAGVESYPSPPFVDQVEYIIEKLSKASHSRRAQAVTWSPLHDRWQDDPPCLQRIWCRVVNGKLEFHSYWRSRDLWKAWWLNVYALVRMQKMMADRLGCEVGRYVDVSSALHIYERDWEQVEKNFVRICESREERERYLWDRD